MDNDETLYTASEVVKILIGLDNVYYSKPWFVRWMFKPWHDALQTAAMVMGGDTMLIDYEEKQLFDHIENYLGDEE